MKKVLSFLAIAAVVSLVACQKSNPKKPSKEQDQKEQEQEKEQEPEYVVPITIDGDFADWAKLDASKVASAKSDPASPWDAVKEIRCYADEAFVFYYIEYNSDVVADLLASANGSDDDGNPIGLPIRLNINTDGEFTSGYTSYSLDGYDFIIEGSLAKDGKWTSFDGTMHQRIDGSWSALKELGLCTGAGKDNKYEICLPIVNFNSAAAESKVPMPMGEEFQTGIRFYTADWGELANMPDGAVTDDNAKGYGHLLNVKVVPVE
ncbi:MAG: hypothetical protein IJ813_07545 [Bacteroidales bacterium]|nr:hypothetical protein [Bacteroidales bacterium]